MSRARINADQAHTESFQSSHIIPDVLYPAVAGKLLDGSTSHSGAYGTAQSDTRSYYYTDIKGSKPIKDPRIGAHFGSQRHKFTSLQLLEQETATHGENVYSIDGRKWARGVQTINNGYDAGGTTIGITSNTTSYIEVVGYFNDINVKVLARDGIGFRFTLNGGTEDTTDRGATTQSNPFYGRYVDSTNVVNVPINDSLGINTVKLRRSVATEPINFGGIELIAQDTTSTATKSQIQIPSQNVVSYGKKFTVAGTPHYDPFNGFANNTSLFSAFVDTATSLGIGTATTWGAAWDKGSNNHIRPYNGGRIVKWVDSSGVIKTSVNMMPANAQNLSGAAAAEITTPSATNVYLPAFSDDAIDHSLAEVAKTFHWREFGNGAANCAPDGAGDGVTDNTYADASMLSAADGQDLAYVMDDGLTSISGLSCYYEANGTGSFMPYNNADFYYMTFIGTGLTFIHGSQGAGTYHLAQNLPYGTHILKIYRTSVDPTYTIDGAWSEQISNGTYGGFTEVTFHQPKMPPIPENAVVVADYMLMADFVKQTGTSADIEGQISKGSKYVSASRDHFYNSSAGAFSADSGTVHTSSQFGLRIKNTNGTATRKLPFFGTTAMFFGEDSSNATYAALLGGASTTLTDLDNTGAGGGKGDANTIAETAVLGMTYLEVTFAAGHNQFGTCVATPIHTSSHYQTFETPFLHELVGGDRNMEQTNLVVTPDGQTWDEVTRDVSYIGKMSAQMGSDTHFTPDETIIFDDWRGFDSGIARPYLNKDWAIAYDRLVCLKSGQYLFFAHSHSDSTNRYLKWEINGTRMITGYTNINDASMPASVIQDVKRGDYIQLKGIYGEHGNSYSSSYITRL